MRKSIPRPQGIEKPGRGDPPRTHRNEFPTGYSLAGRSPALPASASPAKLILQLGAHILQLSQKRAQSSHTMSHAMKRRPHLRALRFAVLSCVIAATCLGQRGPTPYYEDTNNVPVSPEIHADRTVTFRLFAPKASEVVLMGSPGILEAIKKPMPLQRDAQGVWGDRKSTRLN